MKLIIYAENTEKAGEAVEASRSIDAHPETDLIGVRMSSGTFYSVERRKTGTSETLTVRQQTEGEEK